MGSVFSGWYKASVYDPATGTVVQLNKLSIENTAWEEEIITNDSTQSNVYGGKRYKLTLAFFDTDGLSQLETWQRNRTPVRAVAAGPTNLQWYESVPVKVTKLPRADKRSGLNLYQIEMESIGSNPSIYTNQNLLAYLGWADANSDGIPDNYTSGSAFSDFSFSAVTGIATGRKTGTTAAIYLSANIVFPIADVFTTSSVAITAIGTLPYTNQLINTNYAGSTLGGVNSSLVSAVGIRSIAVLSPASNYRVRVNMFNSGQMVSDPSNIGFKFPSLTTNGKLTKGTEFMDW